MRVTKKYKVFTRNWWKVNNSKDENGNLLWSDGLEPDGAGRQNTIGYADNEEEARKMCKEYNDSHPKTKLGRMAEFKTNY